jgi:hypothetical protein
MARFSWQAANWQDRDRLQLQNFMIPSLELLLPPAT